MDCSPPGSSVCGILQARILEWVAISFSRDLPDPGIEPMSPALEVDSLPSELPRKPPGLPGKLDHMVNSIFTFKRKLHTVFHSTNLHSHSQCKKFPFLHILFDICYL
ncbi:unnamed protein product [Rangifer tarandus platyrhynchus]|uniref:Uncharacterized protein n=2 Tax=Rangifer tarandus platyrhynchus TaxID=3082113 RepID=A0ABN8XVW8_RANTA|nr:unnamed protein product [Rangifer tarandus platyrhynchus]